MKYLLALLITVSVYSQQKLVYLADIDGEIDLGLAPYITRVVREAEKNNASAIIFKINTFGGRVDAATQIKDAILSSKILTIGFINNRAISAGALIALSCNKIVMVPGSSIGAATVVDQSGEKVGEKYQSYMRSEMRSTAERNGRRTDIAEGMVDERVVIEGLTDSTHLITLTSEEAYKYKIADSLITDYRNVLTAFNLKNAEIVHVSSNWAEEVVRFLNNPIISSILIMIGFFGLMAEIKTPGWGLPGTAGLIALILFFGSSYILQLASMLEILLFVLGLVLLLAEIFIIPGFGVTGVSGIALILVSIFLALLGSDPFLDMKTVSMAIIQLSVSLVAALTGIFLLAKFLPKSTAFSRLVLAETQTADKGFVSFPSDTNLIGKTGIAYTTLRPGGTALIDDRKVDVVADSEYIEKDKKIKVIRVEGIKVVVTAVKD
ncbi:MAG: nodulation protein NfeD [Ignavibacteriota bacterium]|nr:nodulation protein NfeD [Ignavibacteriota bacterium]MBW7843179.1 nodulation protein NfeD [Ignavibacterium sp.]MCO6446966.1 nodulation protein NfeD [Ignavibacterium album]MCZ2267582.1 nodulation protein NfeD [Ignavibacteriales bacterium]HOJ06910.1 NfeD family protein [Ignavibacteriaceae bacterium]